MGRVLVALAVALACCAVTSTAFAKKGFYIGGGVSSQSASGDLDGKKQVTNSAGDRLGSIGKLDSGSGLDFDLGYNFGEYFGFEYMQVVTLNKAKHQLEKNESDAGVVSQLLGIRLTAPMAEWLEGFLRLGAGSTVVSYDKFGHAGTTAAGVFTATDDRSFDMVGAGPAWGLGLQFYAGQHLGISFGYTVFNTKFTQARIGDDSFKKLPKNLAETVSATDATVTWHF